MIGPETGLDAIRHVGIRGDGIARIATRPLAGTRTIDAQGLVVAPGFIDLNQHAHNEDELLIVCVAPLRTANRGCAMCRIPIARAAPL